MINLILILVMCQSEAQLQIPEYTSGTISLPAAIQGASLTSPITNTITKTFPITFTVTPQIYLATTLIHQYKGQICLAATIMSKSQTQFSTELKICQNHSVYRYVLSYLAVNDPYVFIYNNIISPSSASTTQTINFGAYNWVKTPAYSIAILGLQFQNTQTSYASKISITAISITSATVLITENNLAGLYYPIQYNILFTCPEFLNPVTQEYSWSSGYINIIEGATPRYSFPKPEIYSASTYIQIQGFSGIGFSNQDFIRLMFNSIAGYITQESTCYPDLQITYSAFNYQPFVCNGIVTGNQCTCSIGYYITFSGCLKCTPSCTSCTTTATNCQSCISNAYKQGSTCLCNNGYYLDNTLSCSQCDSSCLTCYQQPTYCTSCPTGKVTVTGQCQTCPTQTQNINGACVACQSNCDSCYLAYCTQCLPFYLYQTTNCDTSTLQIGTCVSQCQSGYFQNNVNSCCQCSSLCATCSSYAVCLTCIANYVLQGSTCQLACNLQYFSLNGTCTQCYSTCKTCNGVSNNACLQCISPLYIYQGQCVTTCPDLTSLITGSCVQCYQGCQTCFGTSQNQCSTCQSNYYQLLNSCYQFCPLQYYQNTINYQCTSCPNNCNICKNTTECTSCVATFYIFNNICYPQCPDQTYNSQKTCQLCDPSCAKCLNGSLGGCTVCSGNLLLSQGYCVDTCLNGYFQSGTSCIQCNTSCQQCSGSSTYCIACSASKYLVNNQCVLTCQSGFYGDISQGLCFVCHSSCLTCYGPSQFNCLSCTNTLYDNTCIQNCPSGTNFYNGQCFDQSPKVFVCALQCNGCFLSQYSCINCVGNRENNPPLCSCQSGYYDIGEANCFKCDHKCQSCVTSPTKCIVCLGNRRTNECACPSGFYDDFTSTNCVQCLIPCSTCAQSPSNCLTCRNNRILSQSSCNCLIGYFEANTSFCQLCSSQCTTCINQSTNCLTCSDIRILVPTCKCPDGYYDNGQVECLKCPLDCFTCSVSACITCQNNRIGPSSYGTCDCPVGAISLLPYSSYCQDCDVAVPFVFFDALLKSLIIDFKVQIQTTIQKCSQVLDQTTINKLGSDPHCQITNTQIKINLGDGATIVVGDVVKLLPNTIKGSLNSSPCTNFYTQFAAQAVILPSVSLTSLIPTVTFAAPDQLSSCQSIQISIQKQYYDGMRPFIYSQLQQVLPPNDQNKALQSFIQQMNDPQSNLKIPLIIPAYTLSHRTTYKFSIMVTSFINLQNTQQIQFTTGQTETVNIQFLTTQVAFYRYMRNNISAQISYSNCSLNPVLFTTLDAQWYVNTSLFSQSEISGLDSGFNTMLLLSIPPFNLSFGQTTLNLQIVLQPNLLLASQTFIFDVIRSPLAVSISGANQQYGLTQTISLLASVVNHDYQSGDPIQQYTYGWSCQDISLQKSCQDMQGNVIQFTTSIHQNIPPKTLTPYRAYLITLQIQYGSNTTSTSGSLTVTELDLPVLSFNKTQVFNLFDESIIKLIYPNTNADSLSYSAAIVYNLDVQTTFAFYYLSLRYKQWNYFSKLNTVYSGNITLRTTVYDPRYYMPSIAQIHFIFNIPPQNCQIFINTDTVIEFHTTLIISVNGCTSTNLPLFYRYSIYTSNLTFNSDIQTSQDLNRIVLQDYTINLQQLHTYLFFNQTDTSSQQTQIIMISIKDSLNGITNITKQVTVELNTEITEQLFTNYINAHQSLSAIIYAYQLVGNRLMTLNGLVTYKSQVYSILLQYVSVQLTPSLTCVVQQVTSQLSQLEGITSVLSLQQANAVSNQISSMISTCISTLSNLNNLQLNGVLDSSSFIVYYQNYQSINYLIQLLSSQINYFTVRNQSNLALTQLLESTIVQIQNLSVPNQPPAQTYSKYLNMFASLSSEKMINSLTGNLLQQQTTLGANKTRLLQMTTQVSIYKYSNKIFNNNPYYQDDSFPKNSSNFSCVDISLVNQQTQVAQQIQQNANIVLNLKQQTNNTLSCISKISGSWQANICKTKKVNSTVSCNCQQLSPVSLMLAFDQIEEQTAKSFTSDAINALASFHFQETIVFYVYIIGTLCYVYVLYKGYQLDKIIRNQDIEIQRDSKIKPAPEQSKQNTKLRRFNQNQIIKSDDLPLKHNQNEPTNIPNKIKQFDSETSIPKDEEQISKMQAYIMFVKQFHILFSIFYKFDKSLSRPVRCTIYYISTLGMLSTTFMFGKSTNISLNIAIGLILAPMTKIFTLIFEKLISNSRIVLRYIGVFLMSSVCGFWSYMLLTQIALLGDVYEVNYLTINFTVTWIFDNCLYCPIQLIFQFVVQTYIIDLPFMREFMKKILDEESQQFIENLSQQLYDA